MNFLVCCKFTAWQRHTCATCLLHSFTPSGKHFYPFLSFLLYHLFFQFLESVFSSVRVHVNLLPLYFKSLDSKCCSTCSSVITANNSLKLTQTSRDMKLFPHQEEGDKSTEEKYYVVKSSLWMWSLILSCLRFHAVAYSWGYEMQNAIQPDWWGPKPTLYRHRWWRKVWNIMNQAWSVWCFKELKLGGKQTWVENFESSRSYIYQQ